MESAYFNSSSPFDTKNFGVSLAKNHSSNSIFLISGGLGAGKTTFCRGFLSYYKIDKVISPTFNIINDYNFENIDIYHIDLYRVSNTEDLLSLSILDVLDSNNSVILIEWPQLIIPLLKNLKKNIYKVELNQKNSLDNENFSVSISVSQIFQV